MSLRVLSILPWDERAGGFGNGCPCGDGYVCSHIWGVCLAQADIAIRLEQVYIFHLPGNHRGKRLSHFFMYIYLVCELPGQHCVCLQPGRIWGWKMKPGSGPRRGVQQEFSSGLVRPTGEH